MLPWSFSASSVALPVLLFALITPHATLSKERCFAFEEERGQTALNTEYIASALGYRVALSGGRAQLWLADRWVGMGVEGAHLAPLGLAHQPQPGLKHYYPGWDPKAWTTDVHLYSKVRYFDLLPGVDAEYYCKNGSLEVDLILEPGFDSSSIRLAFTGIDTSTVSSNGDLELNAGGHRIVVPTPTIYQMDDGGGRQLLLGGYRVDNKGNIAFDLSGVDPSRHLVIDPVLLYGSFFGGVDGEPPPGTWDYEDNYIERITAVGSDSEGAIYVAGQTSSPDFPGADCSDSCQGVWNFVSRFSHQGNVLDWTVLFGNSTYGNIQMQDATFTDSGETIAVGNSIFGYDTDIMDPTPLLPFSPDCPSDFGKAWMLWLNSSGEVELAASLPMSRVRAVGSHPGGFVFAGTGAGIPYDADTGWDSEKKWCVAQNRWGPGLPEAQWGRGAFMGMDNNGGVTFLTPCLMAPNAIATDSSGATSIFDGSSLARLAPNGTQLGYQLQLLGRAGIANTSNHHDYGGADLTVDKQGNAYLAATVKSSSLLPTTIGQSAPAGRREVYVAKVNTSGGVEYATYLGGGDDDNAKGIAVDRGGSAYIVGNTASHRGYEPVFGQVWGHWVDEEPFPLVPDPSNLFDSTFGPYFSNGVWDGFFTRLDPRGGIVYSSYFGGSYEDVPFAIALDNADQPIIGGRTRSRDLRVTNTGYQTALAGFSYLDDIASDGFIYRIYDGILFPTLPTDADFEYSGIGGDPVNTFTGELVFDATPDMVLRGPQKIVFKRAYASGIQQDGPLGYSWRHNLQASLEHSGNHLKILSTKGRELHFARRNGEWFCHGCPGYAVVEDGAEFVLADVQSFTAYRFDAQGQLVAITTPTGRLTLTPGPHGPVSVSNGTETSLALSYDHDGHLTELNDGDRSVFFSVIYNQLVSVTDTLQRTTSYTYATGSVGHMLRTIDPEETSAWSHTWDQRGRVQTQTDFANGTWTFRYEEGNITTIEDPLGHSAYHIHDQRGVLVESGDELERVTQLTSTEGGQWGEITNPSGGRSNVSYDPSGLPSGFAWPDGTATETQYGIYALDGAPIPLVESLLFVDGTTETYHRNGDGQLIRFNSRKDKDWHYEYNGQGQIERVIDPDLGETAYTYNSNATLATLTDSNGVVTSYIYDGLRRLQTITRDGASQTFTWDDADQLVAWEDANGQLTQIFYNDNGWVERVLNPLLKESFYAYDPLGRITELTDERGQTMHFGYTARGDIAFAEDENGDRVTFDYDRAGQLIASTDGESHTFTRAYDDNGNLTALTTPEGRLLAYSYDDVGRLTELTSPESRVFTYDYDMAGRPKRISDPAGNEMRYSYDLEGRLTKVAAPGMLVTKITRNAAGYPTAIQLPRGGVWQTQSAQSGRIASQTDPLGVTTSYAYDSRGRMTSIATPENTLTVGYDPAGNVSSRSWSDGTEVTHSWDALNRRTSSSGLSLTYDDRGATSSCNGLLLGRDDAGQLTTVTVASGKDISYAYDGRGLLESITDWTGAVTTFEHDQDGLLTAIRRANNVDTIYNHDQDGQITGLLDQQGASVLAQQVLIRGVRGFVTSATRSVPTTPTATAVGGWTATYDLAARRADGSYDSMGRLLGHSGRTFTWNAASRLTGFDPGTGSRQYSYDGLGALLSRTVGGVDESFVWNYGLARPSIQVARAAGSDETYYITTPNGSLLAAIDAATETHRYYHFDEAGTLRFTTDDSGAVVGTFAHTPYGELLATSGPAERFTWLGQHGVLDEGEGLYHMRERVYDAVTARYLSRDPSPGQIHPLLANPYAYAAGNPHFYVDPGGALPEVNMGQMDSYLSGTDKTHNLGILSGPATAAGVTDVAAKTGAGLSSFAANRFPPRVLVQYGGKALGNRKQLLKLSSRLTKVGNNPRLGAAGQGLFAAGATWELIKANDRMVQALADSKRTANSNRSCLENQLDAIADMRRSKQITVERAEELSRMVQENWDYMEANERAEASGIAGFFGITNRELGIFTEAVIGTKNSLGAASPVPLDWVGLGDPPRDYIQR